MKTLLITGETYVHRRRIKSFGGKWQPELKGWVIDEKYKRQTEEFVKDYNLTLGEANVREDVFKKLEGEELRKARQERANRKAELLEERAESRERKANKLKKETDPYITDWAFVTQPILVGHHSEKRFRNLKNRINNKVDKRFELLNEAEDLRDRAERLKNNVVVKGDAKREREAQTEFIRSKIKIGDDVQDWIYQKGGKISKINKKTYLVENSKIARNIEFIKSINGKSIN